MSNHRDEIGARLERLRSEDLYRTLAEPQGLDFTSNDYLGLALHPQLWERTRAKMEGSPVSAPASRLLRGHTGAHAALEERLARYKGTEAALFFPSGYQANIGLITTLIRPNDRAISDARNHASIIDGLRLSGCQKTIVPHLDLEGIERHLRQPHASGRTFLVSESLFSMDGDIAPLDRYADLADKYGASLIVDDAHATGVYGPARGSGLTEHFAVAGRALAIVATCGKALGVAGAFVAAPRVVIEYLVNRSRAFIFTTAVPPLLIHAVEAALDLAESHPALRGRVLQLADQLRKSLRAAGCDCLRSEGPIVPVLLGENARALAVAAAVRAEGFDVRAIRPPTVPPHGARLRISVHADHSEQQIASLACAVGASAAQTRATLATATP